MPRERTQILKGDKVRFRPLKASVYRQIYDLTKDDVFTVAHVEPRDGRRCLYLRKPDREEWIPAWPSALLLVQRRPD